MLRLFRCVMLVVSGLFTCPLQADVFLVGDEDGVLWNVDPVSGDAEWIGNLGVVMTDIAFSPSGELFGISPPDDLYRIGLSERTPDNPDSIPSTLIGSLGITNRGPIGRRDVYSLEFDSDGTLFFATFAPFAGGELGTVNIVTAEPALVGIIGFNNGGDLAFAPDGRLFMNETPPSGLMLDPNRSRPNRLIEIDPSNGRGTLLGSIGFRNVFGMDFVGDTLFGHTLQGELISIDTATGAGTLVANTSPMVAGYGASSTDVFVPPLRPRFESHLPPATGAKNLILVTHGWNPTGEDRVAWVDVMAAAIEANIDDPSEWEVIEYQWEEAATEWPGPALQNAFQQGALEGQILVTRNYDHVHLIGHSAGAALVDGIAQQIELGPHDTTIHTTFLDAYVPPWVNGYGASSDWSDHYLNEGDAVFTNQPLANAHNVNVTNLNPIPPPYLTLDLIKRAHAWPRQFYLNTILDVATGSDGYGFPLSHEAGGWNPGEYPMGTDEVTVLGEGELPEIAPWAVDWSEEYLNLEELEHSFSSDGLVEFLQNAFTMETSSPVWLMANVDIAESVNLLRFNLEFTGDPGAEGLLAVYFDSQLLGAIDERFALNNVQTYVFELSDSQLGSHVIAFRLDPFTDVASSVHISSLEWGVAYLIPEPSTFVMCFVLIAVGLTAVYLRHWKLNSG